MTSPLYKRVLLKLSGEALMGEDQFGINRASIEQMVGDVVEAVNLGVEMAIVIGGEGSARAGESYVMTCELPGVTAERIQLALTNRAYWLYNAAAIAICVLVTAFVPLPAMLYATPLGLLAGALMGLKMGFGESIGPWKMVDRFFNRNRGHQRTTETGSGRARRERRRTGEREPDLISVESRNTTSRAGQQDASAANKRKKR